MTFKMGLAIPDELHELVIKYCEVMGRSKSAACIDWIQRGILQDLVMMEKAGLIERGEIKAVKSQLRTSLNGNDLSSEESPDE